MPEKSPESEDKLRAEDPEGLVSALMVVPVVYLMVVHLLLMVVLAAAPEAVAALVANQVDVLAVVRALGDPLVVVSSPPSLRVEQAQWNLPNCHPDRRQRVSGE